MTAKRIRSSMSWTKTRNIFEPIVGEDKTVPNEAMTIQQMLVRAMGGIPQDSKKPVYQEGADFDSPDVEKIVRDSPVERSHHEHNLKVEISEKKEILKKRAKAQSDAQRASSQGKEGSGGRGDAAHPRQANGGAPLGPDAAREPKQGRDQRDAPPKPSQGSQSPLPPDYNDD